MRKLILASAFTAAALSLAACGYDEQEYNQANADYNTEEANYADNGAGYDNAADNYSNEVGNMDNGADMNESENETTGNYSN